MYLITAYFDDSTNKKLQHLMDGVADCSGNAFMKEHGVPPHLTISAFETRRPDGLIPAMEYLNERRLQGEVQFVSVGVFLPYVMYVTPVLGAYLHGLAVEVHDAVCGFERERQNDCDNLHKFTHADSDGVCASEQNDNDSACTFVHTVNGSSCNDMRSVSGIEDINVNKYYNPAKWFPHVTIGKTLDEEQMRQAFSYVQKHFVPFTGRIVELGLARTNPHEDIVRIEGR